MADRWPNRRDPNHRLRAAGGVAIRRRLLRPPDEVARRWQQELRSAGSGHRTPSEKIPRNEQQKNTNSCNHLLIKINVSYI